MRHILLIYALLYLLVAGGLLFKKSGLPTALLGAFVLLFGFEVIDFLYGTSQLKYIYPQYFGYYYFLAGFLYGPLLLWHFKFYLEKDFSFRFWQSLHFIPFAIVLIYLWDIFSMPGKERIAYISENFVKVIMPLNYAKALHLLTYGIMMIAFLFKKRHAIKAKDKLYAWSVVLIYFISCVIISWFTLFANTWRDFGLYYIIACNIVVVIGLLLYTDPDFLQEITQKYLNSGISKNDKKRIARKIQVAISDDKAFLRNDLSLTMLGTIIGEKNHSISQTFSEEFKEGFHSFVNRHRVEYAKELLIDPNNQKYTIEAIGQEAGFNNRVSFNKAFRQYTSLTPSEYRKDQIA